MAVPFLGESSACEVSDASEASLERQEARSEVLSLASAATKHRFNNAHMFILADCDVSICPDDGRGLSNLSMHSRGTSSDYCIPCGEVLGNTELFPLPCIRLPAVLLHLVFRGHCHEVVPLGRWACDALADFRTSVPPLWLEESTGRHAEPPPTHTLTVEATEDVIACMRGLCRQVMEAEPDADIVSSVLARTQRCLRELQSHLISQRPTVPSAQRLPEPFVRQVLCSLDLRNRAKLQEHAQRFVECFPQAFHPSLNVWIKKTFYQKSPCNGAGSSWI